MIAGLVAKLTRILEREGAAGLVNRVRHTPLRTLGRPAAPPRIAPTAMIRDHGWPALAGNLRDALAGLGITVVPEGTVTDADITTWHVGMPPDGAALAAAVLLAPATLPADWPQRVARAAMVLDHDPARLAALARMPLGRPHYMAVPAPRDQTAPPPPGQDRAPDLARALHRSLILAEALPPDGYDYRAELPQTPAGTLPRLCVSLPEQPDRLAAFRASGLPAFTPISGLRRQPGWKGAAATYRQLARDLRARGCEAAAICQDDAVPGADFDRRLPVALQYFRDSGADLFTGLVTDVDEGFRVTRVVRRGGVTLVHLNRSIGLVFNIFGPRALDHLAVWREDDPSGAALTIDRHLGAAEGLDVVTCLPFLVGHRQGAYSSIWGFRNDRYDTLVAFSEKRLGQMVAAFEAGDRPAGGRAATGRDD